MNDHIKMNASGHALEKALAEKFREVLRRVSWLSEPEIERFPAVTDRGFDLLARIRPPGRKPVEMWIECKASPRPSQFPSIFFASEGGQEPVKVLAAPHISPRLAEVCREHGWSWFDLAGNHCIDVPGVLRLQEQGHKPVHATPKPKANLSTPEAGRIVRAVLHPDRVGMRWTQRHLAVHFGDLTRPIPKPSLGLVNKVVHHLRDEAFVEEAPEGGICVRDPVKLLFAWRDVYRFDRHERLGYFTLAQGKKLREALENLDVRSGGRTAYAAFSAAEFQAPHVRQPKTWLYVGDEELSEFEEILEAKAVDSGENIVVLLPDDDGVFYLADAVAGGGMACTNPVQTYVDLWHCGGRGREAAEALLEQRLKPEWRARGLTA